MCMASITNRVRVLQDLTAAGLNRFFDAFREGMSRDQARDARQSA